MGVLARRPSIAVAAATGLLLALVSGRYGYHRDELYFLEAGRHLAWGYPDQPPIVPALARLMSWLAPSSLPLLRLPSMLVAVAVVLLAGAMARRLGARPSGEAFAAAATATSGFVLAMGHLLSTATVDLLGWTLLTYLFVRLLQGDLAGPRPWLLAGLVAGVTLMANVLVAFLLVGVLAGLLISGPRALLRSRWPWVAAGVALLVGLPYLLWQANNGWPQLRVAGDIAAGGSGSSVSRPLFLPLLLVQAGPWLAPVWIAGLVRLRRDPRLRCLATAFLVLVVLFLVLGGKPYYLAGLFPLLLAAGAQPVVDRVWRWVPAALVVLSLPAVLIALPVLPERAAGPAIAINYDLGETIGWPRFAAQVAAAYDGLPAGTAIVTGSYGEAGALDRYGPPLGLPRAYSGHNAYAEWGHPPGRSPALMVGVDPGLLRDSCAELRTVGRLTSPHDLDIEENGTVLSWCVPARSWRSLWPSFTQLG
jgi:4-amino-4-deoxy-L-arabinose transferase-like glycosyltransferase